MSRPSVTASIGGFEVSTTKLRPTVALKLTPKLLKIVMPALRLAPVFGPLMRLAQDGKEITPGLVLAVLGQVDVDELVVAMTELLGTLDDATLDMLYRELLADTSIVVPNDAGVLTVVELNTVQMVDIAFGGIDNGIEMLVRTMLFVGKVNFERSFFAIAGRLGLKKTPESPARA